MQDLDTGVLGEGPGPGNDLDALGQDLFENSSSLVSQPGTAVPSPGGPMLTQHTQPKLSSGPGSQSQPPASPAPSPYTQTLQSPVSVPPPPSPAHHQFAAPSPAPPPSPAQQLQLKSPVLLPPQSPVILPPQSPVLPPPQSPVILPPQSPVLPPPQSPANILYAKSPAAYLPPQSPRSSAPTPVMSPQPLQTSNSIFLSAAPAQTNLLGGTVLTQPIQLHPGTGGQMFQLQLQPNVSVGSLGSLASQNTKLQPIMTSQAMSLPGLPLTPNKGKQPQLLPKPSVQASVPASSPAISQSPGGQQQPLILSQAGIMMGGQQQQLLIQQPQTNMMILRPGGPTVLPMAGLGGLGGQIIVQQSPAPQPGTIMPNVKLITPQGQMQMQKIQTPTGPKLIAVPLGQTLIQAPGGQLMAQSPNIINTSGQIQLQAAPSTFTLQPASSGSLAGPVIQSLASTHSSLGLTTNLGPGLSSLSSPNVITPQPTVIQPQLDSASPTQSPVSPTKKKKPKKKKKEDEAPSIKPPGAVDLGALMKDVGLDFGDDFGFGLDPSTSQQSLELNDSTENLNNSLNSSHNSSSSSEISASPAVEGRQPQSLQLVQGPDGNYNFILQSNTAQPVVEASPVVSTPTPSPAPVIQASKPPPRVPVRNRNIVDSNRTPLYEDDTLPQGWHRKVSQRKSGASAGRYEVFIIGPSGKRFRSRNELKTFFEKTGETKLNPDDFDFSTFGRNNPKVSVELLMLRTSTHHHITTSPHHHITTSPHHM